MQQFPAKVYSDFCEFIEKDSRISQFGLYGISGGILTYAFLRRRPITKFVKPKDIPDLFIREKVKQTGVISKINHTDQGPTLLINHKPPFNVSFSKKELPVKLAGVAIDGNGLSWLQMLTSGKEVVFIPLSNKGMVCHAKVFLVEKNKGNFDIGKELVSLGFARVIPLTPEIDLNSDIERYFKQLKTSEFKAKTLRKGQWIALPENWILWKIRTSFNKILFNLKPFEKKIIPIPAAIMH